jgi:hypothetical protein
VYAAPAAEESRAANRKQFFRTEVDGIEPNPVADPVTDREIDILGRKVDVVRCRRDLQLDLGIGFGKPFEPADQPFGGGPGMAGEVGGAADRPALSRRSATARAHRARPQMGNLAPPEILMRRGDAGALCDFGSPAPGAAQPCATLLRSNTARGARTGSVSTP